MGLLTVSVMLAVVLLTDQVRGDACKDLMWDCIQHVTVASQKMLDIVGDDVTNVTTVVEQCQTVQAQIASCEQELPKVCPASFDFNGASTSLQRGYNSMCGPDPMCHNQLNECQLSPASSDKITEALLKSSPDWALVQEICSQLNASVEQCVATLRADCSQMPQISSAVEAIHSGFQHLCGKETMCYAEISKCKPLAANLSAARGSDNFHEMCRLTREAQDCVESSLDPECLTLPEIRPLVEALTSPLTKAMCSDEAMECPQIFQCLHLQEDGNTSDNDGQCGLTGNMLECVDDLKDTCKLKEEPLTFSELSELSREFCIELKAAGGLDSCSQMGQCVLKSDIVRQMLGNFGGSSSSALRIPNISDLMDAAMWTGYLEAVSGCIVSSAAVCHVDSSLASYMAKQNAYLKARLSSSSHGLTLRHSTLVLLVAVFTAWAHASQ